MSTQQPAAEASAPSESITSTTRSTSTAPSTSDPPSADSRPAPSDPTTDSQNTRPIAQPKKSKPFPSITGGCVCNTIRYRLLTSPLFSYACHCPDCQRTTGSAFGHFLNIETYNIRIISPTVPIHVSVSKRPVSNSQPPLVSRHVECPQCKTELWSVNSIGPMVADVRVGTLDFPSLMEPDVHAFVESKVEWLRLPEGARTTKGQFKQKSMWPESSLRRLDICLERWAKRAKDAELAKDGMRKDGVVDGDGPGGDGEKTPTAGEFVDGEGEDDDAFEKRFRETERGLQERLEVLRRKLEEQEGNQRKGHGELEELTGKLRIGEKEEREDGIVPEPVD